jgi:hypothetical protein
VPFALLLGVGAVGGMVLAGKAAQHPGRTRWIVTATAFALALPWLAAHR